MALRIYPIRPLRPRGYYGQASPAAAFTGGEAMGKMAGNAMLEFQKWQAQQKQKQQQDALNAQANQIENTFTPPRAGLVAPGVNPQTGAANVVGANVPTAGTAPFSTGVAGMQLQQNFIKAQLENQRLAQEIRNNQIAANLAARRGGGGGGGGGGGNASRWQQYLGGGAKSGQVDQFGNPVKAGKPVAYQPGSSTPNDPGYYNFNHQRADIDAQYGKGTYDRLLANAGNITVDPKTGKYAVKTDPNDIDPDTGKPKPVSSDVTVDPDTGDVTLKGSGQHAGAHIPFNDLKQNMVRYDGTLVSQGKQPRFTDQYLKTQHPETGLPAGDAANPFTPGNTPEERMAIPAGKWYINPLDGKPYQKQAPGQQAPAQQAPAQKTSQVDTGDQNQQVASAGPPSQTAMPSLLQPLPGGQPSTPQQGLAGGDQGQGQGLDFSGQPQLSPVAPQAPVDQSALLAGNAAPGIFNVGAPVGGGLPADTQLGDAIKQQQLAGYLQGIS
jgi:hypothetical protein